MKAQTMETIDALHADEKKSGSCIGRKTLSIGFFFLLVAITVTVLIFALDDGKNNPSGPDAEIDSDADKTLAVHIIAEVELEAVYDLGNVSIADLNYTDQKTVNLNDTQLAKLGDAFDKFDANKDGAWNVTELLDYTVYAAQVEEVFDLIDVDSDGVWAFREMVTFLKALNQTSQTKASQNMFEYLLVPGTEAKYGEEILNILNDTLTSDTGSYMIFEYEAALIFDTYDPLHKGYVTYEAFALNTATSSLAAKDNNEDGLVQLDEFISSSFSVYELTIFALSGMLDLIHANSSNSSNVSEALGYTELAAVTQDLYDCPNMNLISSYYYDSVARRRARSRVLLDSDSDKDCDQLCARDSVLCGLYVVGCIFCSFISGGKCIPGCIFAIAGGCGMAFYDCNYCKDDGGCFSSRSVVYTSLSGNESVFYEKLVSDVKVGDYILTLNGFEQVLGLAHYIEEDNSEHNMYQRKLCYADSNSLDCITLAYSHLLYVDDLDTLKPASDVKLGDALFILPDDIRAQLIDDEGLKWVQKQVVKIEENVPTRFRNIFTESGSVVVDKVAASSYTGSNKYDAMIQHGVLRMIASLIKFYDESLLDDQVRMFHLRNDLYNGLVKPLIHIYNLARKWEVNVLVFFISFTIFVAATIYLKDCDHARLLYKL